MQIAYQDFTPAVLEEKLLSTKYEDLPSLVARANEWIQSHTVQVINLETVDMPLGGETTNMVDNSAGSTGYRLLRVWYQA
jgi:hypothetical protein